MGRPREYWTVKQLVKHLSELSKKYGDSEVFCGIENKFTVKYVKDLKCVVLND